MAVSSSSSVFSHLPREPAPRSSVQETVAVCWASLWSWPRTIRRQFRRAPQLIAGKKMWPLWNTDKPRSAQLVTAFGLWSSSREARPLSYVHFPLQFFVLHYCCSDSCQAAGPHLLNDFCFSRCTCIINLLISFGYLKAEPIPPLTKCPCVWNDSSCLFKASYMVTFNLCTYAASFLQSCKSVSFHREHIVQRSCTSLFFPTLLHRFPIVWIQMNTPWFYPVNDSSGCEFKGNSRMKRQFPMRSGNTW